MDQNPKHKSKSYETLKTSGEVPIVAQWKRIQLVSMRMQVQSLALHCRELWCRSQRRLGSRIAVAVV